MPRNVNSRFMRARDVDPDAEEGRRMGGGRGPGAAVAAAAAGGAGLL